MKYKNAGRAAEAVSFELAVMVGKQVDAEITKALNMLFGRLDWTMEELNGRLGRIIHWDGSETFTLDDAPFLTVGPLQVEHLPGSVTAHRQIEHVKGNDEGLPN